MIHLYIKDLSNDKEGTWGIEPNRLIRFDLEGNQLYFYDFKMNIFGTRLLSIIFNSIVDPLTLKLIDEGHVLPIGLFERYKIFPKIVEKYYKIKYILEMKRNAEGINRLIKIKKR